MPPPHDWKRSGYESGWSRRELRLEGLVLEDGHVDLDVRVRLHVGVGEPLEDRLARVVLVDVPPVDGDRGGTRRRLAAPRLARRGLAGRCLAAPVPSWRRSYMLRRAWRPRRAPPATFVASSSSDLPSCPTPPSAETHSRHGLLLLGLPLVVCGVASMNGLPERRTTPPRMARSEPAGRDRRRRCHSLQDRLARYRHPGVSESFDRMVGDFRPHCRVRCPGRQPCFATRSACDDAPKISV